MFHFLKQERTINEKKECDIMNMNQLSRSVFSPNGTTQMNRDQSSEIFREIFNPFEYISSC